jgi:hypothetical protein
MTLLYIVIAAVVGYLIGRIGGYEEALDDIHSGKDYFDRIG